MNAIPLEETHIALGAKMTSFAGFQMPLKYSSDIEEHLCVRDKVGIFDVSHMGEFLVEGEQALALIQKVCSNDASTLIDGQAQYSCLMNEQGGIVDDLLIYRFHNEKYMLVVNAANIQKDKEHILDHNHFAQAKFTDISQETVLFAVQGPMAVNVLQRLTEYKLSSIPFYHFKTLSLAGIEEIVVSATGYTGAGGFELYCSKKHALSLWQSILKSGKQEGILPIGLGARDTLRLEKGYCLYGNDIDDATTPLEAGLKWITKLNKANLLGKDVLLKQKKEGLSKRLVALIALEKGIPRKGYQVYSEDNNLIGNITSGSFSPVLKKGIALAYVSKEYSKHGTKLTVVNKNRAISVEISKLPFV